MPKEYGVEYPERPLMSTLSDLLGIPHFSTSNGSTVRSDFLRAAAAALNAPVEGGKDALIRAIWEAANRRPMPADRLSRGGTVKNHVLQEIIDGVIENDMTVATPTVNAEHPSGDFLGEDHEDADEDQFDPTTLTDQRAVRVAEQAIREGQNQFRTDVLLAYHNACAITGVSVPAVLDAAHISPYMGRQSNVVSNGLALRKDLHSLFDRRMLAVHERSLQVLVSPVLEESIYKDLEGVELQLPLLVTHRPSRLALEQHRIKFEMAAEA